MKNPTFNRHLANALLIAVLFAAPTTAQTYGLVHAFGVAGRPVSSLIQATDGDLYGTTSLGGASGVGTAFKVGPGSVTTTIHSFLYTDGAYPSAALVQAADGNFYGTARMGGTSNLGTVYRMDESGNVTRLHSFSGADGAEPLGALIQGTDGFLYGTTSRGSTGVYLGTVFKMDTSGTLTTLHVFSDGTDPLAGLVHGTDGMFYGTTLTTVYRIDAAGNNFALLHSFSATEGTSLQASLIQATDGYFYGTTVGGGPNGHGTVFRIDAMGSLTVLHSFSNLDPDGVQPQSSLIQAADGYFYGTNSLQGANGNGTVFKMDSSGNVTRLYSFSGADGALPWAGLIQGNDGFFYGTTRGGGSEDLGTIFKLAGTDDLTMLHSFHHVEGTGAGGLVEADDGSFYGVASGSSPLEFGTVFRLDGSGNVTTLYSFDGSDGAYPHGSLIHATDGFLYGTTYGGGANGLGTVFRITLSGEFTTLHSFDGADGDGPLAGLIQATDGQLYGTTTGDWTGGHGTIFRIDASGGITTLHSFAGADGSGPEGGLLQAADGFLYGSTRSGGAADLGTVFKWDSVEGFTTFHDFAGSDGAGPLGALIQAADGDFYGTTSRGGSLGYGTAFKIDGSGNLTTLHSFNRNISGPNSLLQDPGGSFWGTTLYGGVIGLDLVDLGTAFEMDPNGTLVWVHAFDGVDGAHPQGGMILAGDGSLYGGTTEGGPTAPAGSGGVVFRIGPSNPAVNAILPTSGPASGGSPIEVFGGGFLQPTLAIGGETATDVTVLDPSFLYGSTPALAPGTLNDVTVTDSSGTSPVLLGAYFADFLDVPQADIFHTDVESIFRAGVTAGCGNGDYCRDAAALRKQMAVFVLKSMEGASYAPPPAVGIFTDVPPSDPFAPWIEELYNRGVVAGCGDGPAYCPNDPVLRQQMAVFLLKTLLGSAHVPPACAGIFGDVPCSNPFAVWVEDLFTRGIAAGCGGGDYCPSSPTTRGQMSAFLTKTFGLF